VEKPPLQEVEPQRFVACHLFDQNQAAGSTGASEANERNQQGARL
jgi:oligopeptide transport system ATP-binding protein